MRIQEALLYDQDLATHSKPYESIDDIGSLNRFLDHWIYAVLTIFCTTQSDVFLLEAINSSP